MRTVSLEPGDYPHDSSTSEAVGEGSQLREIDAARPEVGAEALASRDPGATRERTLYLPASLTIRDAAQVRAQLLGALDGATRLFIDARDVEVVDTAGLQLLMSACKSARRRGIAVRVSSPSQYLCEAASLMGVTSHLGFAQGPLSVS